MIDLENYEELKEAYLNQNVFINKFRTTLIGKLDYNKKQTNYFSKRFVRSCKKDDRDSALSYQSKVEVLEELLKLL